MTEDGERAPRTGNGLVLEIGWVFDSRLDGVDRDAALAAVESLRSRLEGLFPDFRWRMPFGRHELPAVEGTEATALVEAGSLELSRRGWDLAVVVTASDLRGHLRPTTTGVLSMPLGVAVLSTFRIDPMARDHEVDEGAREQTMADRLEALGLYALVRLCGLPPADLPEDRLHAAAVLDLLGAEDAGPRERLREELVRIGDQRVEEERGSRERGWFAFHAAAAWRNRRELASNLHSNRSWEFPFRMGRFTTAALAALAILLVTAESWEVGTRVGLVRNLWLAAATVGASSAYLVKRQRLLALHRSFLLTEQIVVARLALVLFVALGTASTYLLLFAVSLVLEWGVIDAEVIARWSGLPASDVGWGARASQAAFSSSLALLVGGLGAALESESYVGHVAYVDEEI